MEMALPRLFDQTRESRLMRRLHSFNGGVHPDEHKTESTARPIAAAPLVPLYVVPLRQHIGSPALPMVRAGDHVLKGLAIGQAEGYVSAAVHAPTSGKVVAVEMRPVAHPSGLSDLCVVIEADGEDRAVDFQPLDWRSMEPSHLRNLIRDMGLAGLGGAVFPSFIKLNPGETGRVETLIINGAECEPWITSDDMLMRERAREILLGAEIMQAMLHAREVVVGIEDNKPQAIAAMQAAVRETGLGFEVATVPTLYPRGGAKQLTYTLTGKETPSRGHAVDVGVQVFNVGTAYSLYHALNEGMPLISRVVTVTGHVARPQNFEARIGTPIDDLIRAAGGELEGAIGEIIGGPMMGFDLKDRSAPVVKAVNCVIVKNPQVFPPPPTPRACIRCGECARACPAQLQPFELYWYARAKDFGKTQLFSLFDCIECGCCSHVCPSHIPLVDYFRFAKSEIWARERDKEAADAARRRHEFHQHRLEREKQEKAERLAKKAVSQVKEAEAAPVDAEAERKKAILQAAIDRAKKAKEGVVPKNVDHLTPEQQKQVEEAEARRARLHEAQKTEEHTESKP